VFTLDRTFALPLRPGERVRRPALAATLAKLRAGGPDAFYRGPIAQAIVESVRAAGGVMTLEDLAGYAPVERAPLETRYRGFRVFSMPPPSSGGIVVAQALAILSERLKEPPRGPGRFSSSYLHVLTEALKHGFADRARHLGDPDFATLPIEKLLDAAYHRELAARIADDRVLPPERYGLPGPASPPKDGGTAHLSVIDADGNAVALTTTINLWFGAQLVAGPTGILLNNQIDDFSLAPDTPNAFGLIGKDKNLVAPNKRPLSSMTPTLVLEGDRIKLAVGGAGGPRIISGTLQVLLNVLDGKLDAQAASASPRVHHQWSPDVLSVEPEFPRDVIEALEKRGHKIRATDHVARVNVVVRAAEGVEAAAELRSRGAPAGY
jgi:gamma-glutamyltranspeptidase/glutathione hydrolase